MYLPSWKHLERESSPVDWCEENYTWSPYIGIPTTHSPPT